MKQLFVALLVCTGFVFAQDQGATSPSQGAKSAKGQVTVQGCVSRSSGDYILMKQDPAITYELQAKGKIRLHAYMGQRVEITGYESPTMASSSDTMARVGSAAPTTIAITSIKTLSKECTLANAQ